MNNCIIINAQRPVAKDENSINLSGTWHFQTDVQDIGVSRQWYAKKLTGIIRLPGSMATNNLGDAVSINTPWTGDIVDSSWFFEPRYARYRNPGNIKVPFWLQPNKYYKGAAWYQKVVHIPPGWNKKHISLFLERCHWQTTVWIDTVKIGTQNALGTPHEYSIDSLLSPGVHYLTIRVDNRVNEVNVGVNSHSISDHTQTNWNGITGKIMLLSRPRLYIDDVQLFPDIEKKQVTAVISLKNLNTAAVNARLELTAFRGGWNAVPLTPLLQDIRVKGNGGDMVSVIYPMGDHPLLWDEFHPNLYAMQVTVAGNGASDKKAVTFGMRSFTSNDQQLLINGRPAFLRGTLECAVFPLTGYPPAAASYWRHIFAVCRSYGLNHIRFHSWCPPEIAFAEADSAGFYLQIECSSWANQGATIGDGNPLDQFIEDESRRIVKTYGNHPSFCMLAYGNEPAGKHMTGYLTRFVTSWKKRDPRRLYTTGAGWPIIPESDYNSTPDPRIQAWGAGLKSIINNEPPRTNYDWSAIIAKWKHPTISHEIGQWCVYPDFREIPQYTGILKAKNFEIFRQALEANGMKHLADSFLLASGKLQVLCYKADIEAALRTKNFGGFQLLGLGDFPGQGTALVGVVNAFWKDKGYISSKEYSRFCNAVVPLARFSKMVYLNNEALDVPVELANFNEKPLKGIIPLWSVKNAAGQLLFAGKFSQQTTIPVGNGFQLGVIRQQLASVLQPSKLTLTVSVAGYENSWTFYVYPAGNPAIAKDIFITQTFDSETVSQLNKGARVLLTLKKGALKKDKGGNIAVGFSSIFWNTAWTHGQPPHTLGILCNPRHPAFSYFPTDYYSDWQWWDAMSHSGAMILDSVQKGLTPIVRVIDDWVTARSLALLFECRVGKGRLLVSSIDLLSNAGQRPEARQLLYSLEKYMESDNFRPEATIEASKIRDLCRQ
ncbi:beta-galactosidase [Niabella ginsenosidivorans]|uniref:beta-galactosidase n=2 Tax=Niabella ginsenosidivorans TaxID=1176587 RepID=A0A1A9I8L2_9BACT|nr:beta-galactosidase [Niabella ginsenosidivorans]